MGKLGLHLSTDRLTGLGVCIAECHRQGNDIPLLFSVDHGGTWSDVVANGDIMKTTVMFRTKKSPMGEDGPAGIWDFGVDVNALAEAWMETQMPVWRLSANRAHYYIPGNEQDPADLAQAARFSQFNLRCMQIADAFGFKLGTIAFSTGNPKDYTGTPSFTLEEMWSMMLPMVDYAAKNGHVITLHEYGFNTTLNDSKPYHALRYRRSMRYLATRLPLLPDFYVTETGAFTGGISPLWLEDAMWYESEIEKDAKLKAAAYYQLGNDETIASQMPQFTQVIASTPTKVALYDPCFGASYETPVQPRVWDKKVVLAPLSVKTLDQYLAIAEQYGWPTRTEVSFSADSAFARHKSMKSLTVIVIDPASWGGLDKLLDFAQTYYGEFGAPTIQVV
jgi:hypothetical protein